MGKLGGRKNKPNGHLPRGTSGFGADMAVDAHPRREDYEPGAPSARKAPALHDGEKPDQLEDKARAVGNRQEALLDEAVEETFPSSDPISPSKVD